MRRIDTMEDFRAVRADIRPAIVRSKTRGDVLVPCTVTLLVKSELVIANAYNPNHVSPDKMALLERSILDNGFCFPIVCIWDDADGRFVIVDGFHRSVIASAEWLDMDYLPVVVLPHDVTQRMAATVQFNKARGVHSVDLDADVVRALLSQGLAHEEIAARLGMEVDSVHRYAQVAGVADLFARIDYSRAWEMEET